MDKKFNASGRNKALALFIVIIGVFSHGTSKANRKVASVKNSVVVTYHPIADRIGYDILEHGGNAFDAFVAATAAEFVLGEGVTSFAGPLGALLYDSNSKKLAYLNATFNDPLDPNHKYDPANPKPGAAVLVPGAVAGLEEISKKHGRLSFSKVLEPAIALAKNGFPLNSEYAGLLRSEYGRKLKVNSYALKTYFKNGEPLAVGETLKLPAVAQFLGKLAKQGSKYVYRGQWASACLKEVNDKGGHLTLKDFSSYKAKWETPLKINYRGYEIYSSPSEGGINTLLSLKVLEQTDLTKLGRPYSSNAEALGTLAAIQLETTNQPWLYDQSKLLESSFIQSQLSDENAVKVWKKIQQKISAAKASPGNHSYQVVIIDREGNAITGTNTIESLPWAFDIFVEGVPLTSSNSLPFGTKPGERRRSPFTMQIGFKDQDLSFAVGAFSVSMWPAEFQFITNIIDYKFSAKEAVSLPRFGSAALDMSSLKQLGPLWLDPRVEKSIVQTLKSKGLNFVQDGYIDTGLGSLAIVQPDGTVEGSFAPLSSVGQSANEIVGIGAALDTNKDDQVIIRNVIAGSPAEKSGLKAQDIIAAVQPLPSVDMVSASGKTVGEVSSLIRGPLGLAVTLKIRRNGAESLITITRQKISVNKR